MYWHELTLIKETYVEDEIGNMVPVTIENTVFCSKKSVTRNEFYSAANTGLKPSIIFVVHPFEYEDEEKVIFEGKKYNVIRSYQSGLEELEITCERVIGNEG